MNGKCRCCEIGNDAAERAVESVRKFLDNGSFCKSAGRNTLFCREHFEKLKGELDSQMQERIEKFQIERLESIYRNLNEIVKKMDYTSLTRNFTEDEMFALGSVVKYFSTFEELSI